MEEKINKAIDLLSEKYTDKNYNLAYQADGTGDILLTKGTITQKVRTFKNWDAVIDYLTTKL